jgi:hypothetical protein
MYICTYVYMHACVCVCVCARARVRVRACVCVCTVHKPAGDAGDNRSRILDTARAKITPTAL